MAKHYAEARREQEESGHVAGISRMVTGRLNDEARDMRNAGRRLVGDDDDTDLIGAVKKLEELIAEQRESNERIAGEMRAMVSEMHDVLDRVDTLGKESDKTKQAAMQMALLGVANAQEEARDMTVKSVEKLTVENERLIDTMVQESKRRIERLSMVTMPDRLLTTGKWVMVNLVLIIIVHMLWGILT